MLPLHRSRSSKSSLIIPYTRFKQTGMLHDWHVEVLY